MFPDISGSFIKATKKNSAIREHQDLEAISPLTMSSEEGNYDRDLVKLEMERDPKKRSGRWMRVYRIDYTVTRQRIQRCIERETDVAKIQAATKLKDALSNHDSYVFCKICYDNKSLPLLSALISCKSRTGISNQNIAQHLRVRAGKCQEHATALEEDEREQMNKKKMSSMTTVQTTTSAGAVSSCASSKLSVATSNTGTADIRSMIDEMWTTTTIGRKKMKAMIREIHIRAFHFFSDANISPNSLLHESFSELLHYCVHSGKYLATASLDDIKMGKYRYRSIQVEQFTEMVMTIREAVVRVREYHKITTGKPVAPPFIYIAHDIWDGRRRCILGLSVFFSDPVYGSCLQIPLGFVVSKGKTATVVAEQSQSILQRYGIFVSDLLKPINDTTNSALAAGRLIVGGGIDGMTESGSCDMHKGSLVVNHASGFLVRKKKKAVVDSFPECVDFRNKVRQMVQYVCDQKSKDRFKRYSAIVKEKMKCDVIHMPVPNSTRTNGVFIMYEAVLRSYWALLNFNMFLPKTEEAFGPLYLTRDQWAQLAEYTAVYYPVKQFLTRIQSDNFGVLSLGRVYLGLMLDKLYPTVDKGNIFQLNFERMRLNVVDVFDGKKQWFPSDNYTAIPKITMAYIPGCSHKKTMKPLSVVTQNTKLLVERLFRECETYFGRSTHDEDMSILFNPVTLVEGVRYLTKIGLVSEGDIEAMEKTLINTIADYFYGGAPAVEAFLSPNKEAESDVDDYDETDLTDDAAEEEENQFLRRAKKRSKRESSLDFGTSDGNKGEEGESLRRKGKSQDVVIVDVNLEEIREDVRRQYVLFKSFFAGLQSDQWLSIMKQYPSKILQTELTNEKSLALAKKMSGHSQKYMHDIGQKKLPIVNRDLIPIDVLYTNERFDLLKFWFDNKRKYHLLYPVAMIILSKPPTNARQERLFSWATWFDTSLRSNLSETGFEMRLLEKANRRFVEEEKHRRKEQEDGDSKDYTFHFDTCMEMIDDEEKIVGGLINQEDDVDQHAINQEELGDTEGSTSGNDEEDVVITTFDDNILAEDLNITMTDGSKTLCDIEDDDSCSDELEMCRIAVREYRTTLEEEQTVDKGGDTMS